MASLTLQGISKRHANVDILNDVSLTVQNGDFLTLVGPSGCGKSTLLRIISGLDLQDEGDVKVDGASISHLPPKLRDLAMVFQSYALYPHMTVFENMAVPLVLRNLGLLERLPVLGRLQGGVRAKRAGIHADVSRVADILELGPLMTRRPGQLSGGQRQRVALGRAMVRQPKLFLMDEPLSNLDAKLRVHMRAEIAALHQRLGTTFIYVTHDQIEAMTLSSRVAVMMDGCILQVAAPAEIYSRPANIRVAEFIGSPRINILDGLVGADGTIEVAGVSLGARLQDRAGEALRVGVRPEQWELSGHGSDQSCIAGQVVRIEQTGPEAMVYFRVTNVAEVMAVRTLPALGAGFSVGDPIAVSISSKTVLLFDAAGDLIASPSVAGAWRD